MNYEVNNVSPYVVRVDNFSTGQTLGLVHVVPEAVMSSYVWTESCEPSNFRAG